MSTTTNHESTRETETDTLAELRVPSLYRDTPDLVIRVEQSEDGPRLAVGDGAIWSDRRAQHAAANLRALADALDPTPSEVRHE